MRQIKKNVKKQNSIIFIILLHGTPCIVYTQIYNTGRYNTRTYFTDALGIFDSSQHSYTTATSGSYIRHFESFFFIIIIIFHTADNDGDKDGIHRVSTSLRRWCGQQRGCGGLARSQSQVLKRDFSAIRQVHLPLVSVTRLCTHRRSI